MLDLISHLLSLFKIVSTEFAFNPTSLTLAYLTVHACFHQKQKLSQKYQLRQSKRHENDCCRYLRMNSKHKETQGKTDTGITAQPYLFKNSRVFIVTLQDTVKLFFSSSQLYTLLHFCKMTLKEISGCSF